MSLGYLWNELRRRLGRTVLTALGLAAGIGLVVLIIGVSDGLSDAQNAVLSPLGSVGTDLIVTRTVSPVTSTSPTPSPTPAARAPGGRSGFFASGSGAGNAAELNSSDQSALLRANSSVLTDLAKLGPAGTHFVHDFFVPGTLITFPHQAISVVSSIPGVHASVGALSLQAVHESGTVPKTVATFKTGGQTIKKTTTPPPLTTSQRLAVLTCLQKSGLLAGARPTSGSSGQGGGSQVIPGGASNPAFLKCLPAAQQSYITKVVVPTQTIRQVLNPPTTNTTTTTYTAGGVDPTNPTTGLVTRAQLVSGHWFGAQPARQVLVNTAYASTHDLHVGGSLVINDTSYTIAGLVAPTLTGNIEDLYFDLPTMQSLSSNGGRVNEVLVSVDNADQVGAVTAAIRKQLPGAQVITAKDLADQVSGSLANAKKLASDLGGALAIVVLLAAFVIAGLLTLSSVAKRVREIGSLRAMGWSRALVMRQILAEALAIGLLGAIIGLGLGALVSGIIDAIGPGLPVTSTGLSVGASTASSLLNQSNTSSLTTIVHLRAPLSLASMALGFAGALLGGLLAGLAGGWRAARLSPATAMRDLG